MKRPRVCHAGEGGMHVAPDVKMLRHTRHSALQTLPSFGVGLLTDFVGVAGIIPRRPRPFL